MLRMSDLTTVAAEWQDLDGRLDLRRAVDSLPWKDRAVVLFRYYLGMDVQETAAALRLSEDAVKARAHRATGRLRAMLPEARND